MTLGAKPEAEGIRETPGWLAQLAFLYSPRAPAPQWHLTVGCSCPHLNQEKRPIGMPTGQSGVGNSSIEVSSSQVTLVCVELTKNTQLRETSPKFWCWIEIDKTLRS